MRLSGRSTKNCRSIRRFGRRAHPRAGRGVRASVDEARHCRKSAQTYDVLFRTAGGAAGPRARRSVLPELTRHTAVCVDCLHYPPPIRETQYVTKHTAAEAHAFRFGLRADLRSRRHRRVGNCIFVDETRGCRNKTLPRHGERAARPKPQDFRNQSSLTCTLKREYLRTNHLLDLSTQA